MRGRVTLERFGLTAIQLALIVQWGILIWLGITEDEPWLWAGGLVGLVIGALTVRALWRMRRPRKK